MSTIKAYNLRIEEVDGHMPSRVRWELVEGELRLLPLKFAIQGEISGNVITYLGQFVNATKLGRAFAGGVGFILQREPDTLRAPDVAFVPKARAVKVPRGFFPGAPDLAVEVVSPDDTKAEVAEKVQSWLEHGTQEVWVARPQTRTISVHGRAKRPLRLGVNDTLDGGDLLPGFHCSVREIFE